MEILVLAERSLRRYAGRLTDVLSEHFPATYADPSEFEASLGGGARELWLISIGENAFTRILVPTVDVKHNAHGLRWGHKNRRAAVWTVDDVLDVGSAIRALNKDLDQLVNATRNLRRGALLEADEKPDGAILAAKYLDPDFVHQPRWGSPAAYVRNHQELLRDLQLTLGIAAFLYSGFTRWTRLVAAEATLISPPPCTPDRSR